MGAEAEFYNAVGVKYTSVALEYRLGDGFGAVVEIIGSYRIVVRGDLGKEAEGFLYKLYGAYEKRGVVLGGEAEDELGRPSPSGCCRR